MTGTINVFFQITNVCDKNCKDCCILAPLQTNKNMLKEKFIEKIIQIKEYMHKNPNKKINIILIGGEAFFYKEKNFCLIDLVTDIRTELPTVKIIIKTAGWEKNNVLNNRFNELYEKFTGIQCNLGFSLFQKNGKDSLKRLVNMFNLFSKYQKEFNMDLIYDKKNLDETINILVEGIKKSCLQPFDKNNEIKKIINLNPQKTNFIKINTKNLIIKTTFSPVYPMISKKDSTLFFDDCEVFGCVRLNEMTKGNNIISYNENMQFIHCDSPHMDIDYNQEMLNSFEEDIEFLKQKLLYADIKLNKNKIKFDNFKERCLVCSKQIYSKRKEI